MSDLAETYAKRVRPCLVAFTSKFFDSYATGGKPPPFPHIIGTGFVVDSEGWIVTNRHVVEAFADVPAEVLEASGKKPPVMATFFHLVGDELHLPMVQVEDVHFFPDVPEDMLTRFAPEAPDLAFVRVNMRGLPALQLVQETIAEGMDLATAGFPMGKDALAPRGYLEQLSPTLQKGIVSAVLPFPGTHPHAFVLNVMVRGGASGSPVFVPESGMVAGIVYAGLSDFESNKELKKYKVPTNLTYVLPAHVIATALEILQERGFVRPQPDAPTLDERMCEPTKTELPEGVVSWEPLQSS